MPWMKLFTEELDRDCRVLSLRARGAWIWIFLDLRHHQGSRSLTLAEWARVIGASIEETDEAIHELIDMGICNTSVTQASRGDALSQKSDIKSDAKVTLTCRRLAREAKAMNSHNIRQNRYRTRRKSDAPGDAPGDAPVTRIDKDIDIDTDSSVVSSYSGDRLPKRQFFTGKTTHTHTAVVDFILTDELREWVEVAAPDLDGRIEAEKFRDYYGRDGKTFANLSAAFRKWIRDAVDRQNQARAQARAPTARWETIAERNAKVFREVEAEDAAKQKQAEQGGRGS
jgi:hypothetical protein